MANYAEIVGEEIRFFERSLIDAKPLGEFFDSFHIQKGWASNRLPENCVFVSNRDDTTIYVVEREPRFVNLLAGYGIDSFLENYGSPSYGTDGIAYYTVPVPWEYYVMAIVDASTDTGFGQQVFRASGLSLYWSKTQVKDLEQATLYGANLPNTSGGGGVCLGDNTSEYQIPHEKMTDTAFNFYDSLFNYDLGMGSGICANLEQWLHYHEDHSYVNLDDTEFAEFPTDGGGSLLEIMKADNFTRLTNPDPTRQGGTNRAFLERLMVMLPEQDSQRLMQLLTDLTPSQEDLDAAGH